MVRVSNQNVFLIQIDAKSFAEFAISEFEISRFDCISLFHLYTGIPTIIEKILTSEEITQVESSQVNFTHLIWGSVLSPGKLPYRPDLHLWPDEGVRRQGGQRALEAWVPEGRRGDTVRPQLPGVHYPVPGLRHHGNACQHSQPSVYAR